MAIMSVWIKTDIQQITLSVEVHLESVTRPPAADVQFFPRY